MIKLKQKIKDSDYKGVAMYRHKGKDGWWAHWSLGGVRYNQLCESEDEAAKLYDIMMLKQGKKPVNKLKKHG